jgi:aldehyde dehydrogenase (NAD+)
MMARHVDLVGAIKCFRYFAGWADKLHGQTMELGPGAVGYTRLEPFGVCGQIIPWNFPFLMWSWKVAPALATGNVIVMKSAEQTPLSSLYGAALAKEAGFPAGTVNVISGLGKVAGSAIAMHPRIRKIAFTGSTLVGRQIMKMAAESNLKKVTLELGGKSPHIVFADADFDKAVETIANGIYFNQGQVCVAGSRAFVEESIYDKFLEALKARTAQVKSGNPFDPTTFQGPQVSAIQCERINALIDGGLKAGAKVVAGGGKHELGGLFITPTVFSERDLRPRPRHLALQDHRGGHWPRQRHRVRPRCRSPHPLGRHCPPHGRRARGRHRLDQSLRWCLPPAPLRRL